VPQIIQAKTDAQDILTGIINTPGTGQELRSGISLWDPTRGATSVTSKAKITASIAHRDIRLVIRVRQ